MKIIKKKHIAYEQTGDVDYRKGLYYICKGKKKDISKSKKSTISNDFNNIMGFLFNQIKYLDRIAFGFLKIFSRKTRRLINLND